MANNQKNPPTGSNLIPLEEAIIMNRRYRAEKDSLLAPTVDPNVLPICETFNRSAFDAILAQEDCVGVRLYFSMKENKDVCIVGVGVNSDDEDMIGEVEVSSVSEATEGLILDNGARCPDNCPPKSDLN